MREAIDPGGVPAGRPSPYARRMSGANIAVWLSDRAASDPNLPSIKQGDTIVTFAALDAASQRFASVLADHGVRPGDRVALIMPNVAYFPIAYYAILRSGAVVVPMNPLLKAGEIAYAWGDAGAKVAVVFALFAEEAAKAAQTTGTDVIVVAPGEFEKLLAGAEPTPGVVDRSADDTAVILYTSGTTGNPKGAELTHDNLRTNVVTSVETLMPSGPGDVLFGGLPLFHSFGQTCAMNCAMYSGACMTLLPKFDAETALQICADDRVTLFLGVPTMYMALLGVPNKERFDTSRLQTCASGGASLPLEVLHGVEQAFGVADHRGVRAVGDLAGGVVQPSRPADQAGHRRYADPRLRVRPARPRRPAGRRR